MLECNFIIKIFLINYYIIFDYLTNDTVWKNSVCISQYANISSDHILIIPIY